MLRSWFSYNFTIDSTARWHCSGSSLNCQLDIVGWFCWGIFLNAEPNDRNVGFPCRPGRWGLCFCNSHRRKRSSFFRLRACLPAGKKSNWFWPFLSDQVPSFNIQINNKRVYIPIWIIIYPIFLQNAHLRIKKLFPFHKFIKKFYFFPLIVNASLKNEKNVSFFLIS